MPEVSSQAARAAVDALKGTRLKRAPGAEARLSALLGGDDLVELGMHGLLLWSVCTPATIV
jgi:hypothetical protein